MSIASWSGRRVGRAGYWGAALGLAAIAWAALVARATGETPGKQTLSEMIRVAVKELVAMQEKDGAWPYEGVYRVRGEIPVGYRVGGTALVCEGLLAAAPGDAKASAAIDRGVAFIVQALDHPLMTPSRKDAYDVRVWGHCFALDLFCRLRAEQRMGARQADIEQWIPKLVRALVKEELSDGGWNYASRRAPASFVTSPVTQALLLARSQGEDVPDAVFERAKETLEDARLNSGTFLYSGSAPESKRNDDGKQLPGSIARSAVCETTLILLGGGSPKAVKSALDAFHAHWDWLEKRRKQSGTHVPPYMIAPYYFYYGHRYAAQAIRMLPEKDRAAERDRLLEKILRTRDEDGTWNDRVFPRSRNFGTTMVVLALLGDDAPLPPTLGDARKVKVHGEAKGAASAPTEK